MNKNIILKASLLFFVISLFTLCSDDNKKTFEEGDTAELKIKVAEALDLLNNANTIQWEQSSIDEFEVKVTTINTVVETEKVSSQEVLNLTMNLEKAQQQFISKKLSDIPYENLIAGWNFDEEGTELKGDGFRGLIASLKPGPSEIFPTTSIPQFKADGKNSSLYFSNGGHLEVEQYNPFDFLGKQLSICVWLKPEVSKGGNYVVSLNYWENWKFQIQEQGKPFFTLKTGAGVLDADNESDLSVKPGEWALVIITLDLDDNTLTFYVNGAEKVKIWTSKEKPTLTGNQAAPYQSPLGKMLPLIIGAITTYDQAKSQFNWSGWDTPATWDYFQGSMDELKFYNIALTSGQVRWLYNVERQSFGK